MPQPPAAAAAGKHNDKGKAKDNHKGGKVNDNYKGKNHSIPKGKGYGFGGLGYSSNHYGGHMDTYKGDHRGAVSGHGTAWW